MYKIQNEAGEINRDLLELMDQFIPHSQRTLKWNKPVTITLISDEENSKNPLGKTAYYSPGSFEVVLYTDGRHVKDILRSLSHELVHHNQNCFGNFGDPVCETTPGYAQNNKHLRKMEKEAYLRGNMIFRDWEDSLKSSQNETALYLAEKYLFRTKEINNMSTKDWMHRERFNNLSERWGIEADFDKIFEGLGHGEQCGCDQCDHDRELAEMEGDVEDLIDMGVDDDDDMGDYVDDVGEVPHVDSAYEPSYDSDLEDYMGNVDNNMGYDNDDEMMQEDPNLGLWESEDEDKINSWLEDNEPTREPNPNRPKQPWESSNPKKERPEITARSGYHRDFSGKSKSGVPFAPDMHTSNPRRNSDLEEGSGETYDDYLARTEPNPRRDAHMKREKERENARRRETPVKNPMPSKDVDPYPRRGEAYDDFLARTEPNPRRDAHMKREKERENARKQLADETRGKNPKPSNDWNRKAHNPLSEESDIESRGLRESDEEDKIAKMHRTVDTMELSIFFDGQRMFSYTEELSQTYFKSLANASPNLNKNDWWHIGHGLDVFIGAAIKVAEKCFQIIKVEVTDKREFNPQNYPKFKKLYLDLFRFMNSMKNLEKSVENILKNKNEFNNFLGEFQKASQMVDAARQPFSVQNFEEYDFESRGLREGFMDKMKDKMKGRNNPDKSDNQHDSANVENILRSHYQKLVSSAGKLHSIYMEANSLMSHVEANNHEIKEITGRMESRDVSREDKVYYVRQLKELKKQKEENGRKIRVKLDHYWNPAYKALEEETKKLLKVGEGRAGEQLQAHGVGKVLQTMKNLWESYSKSYIVLLNYVIFPVISPDNYLSKAHEDDPKYGHKLYNDHWKELQKLINIKLEENLHLTKFEQQIVKESVKILKEKFLKRKK